MTLDRIKSLSLFIVALSTLVACRETTSQDPDPNNAADAAAICGTCPAEKPVCDRSTKQCVGCLGNSDCTDPMKARCELTTHTCEGCAGPNDCSHLVGRALCESGSCAQCTAADESACGGKPCNVLTGTCSAFDRGTQDTCKPCDTDANCTTTLAHACIAMTYQGTARPGGYCLQTTAAGDCNQPALYDSAFGPNQRVGSGGGGLLRHQRGARHV